MSIRLMENVVQHYAWGSKTMLSALQGGRSPADQPVAEVWMGSHPRGLSRLVQPDGTTTALQPESIPFLFKILTAEHGLSIQAHPSKVQAEEGYARENEAGIPVDAPNRNYRDRNHKPELICALTDFWGLRGFRPLSAIAFELVSLVETAPKLPDTFRRAVGALEESPDAESWKRAFGALLTVGGDPEYRSRLVDAAATVARATGVTDPVAGGIDRSDRYWWVLELQRQFPGDPGSLAPLYLNLEHLKPGEAMYLGAQTLHAYLYGAGAEIMASSDNVLRSGCTVKHVDAEELRRVLSFDRREAPVIRPAATTVVQRYETPAAEFELHRVNLGRVGSVQLRVAPAPVIVLAIGGSVIADDDAAAVTIGPGQSAFLSPGTVSQLNLKRGDGADGPYAFVASVPGAVSSDERSGATEDAAATTRSGDA